MRAGRVRIVVAAALAAAVAAALALCAHPAAREAAPAEAAPALLAAPSPFGRLTSARWAYGAELRRVDLRPVPNTNPHPEPQPRRDHPFGIAIAPDGRKAYVTLAGNEAEPGREVAVFDVERRAVLKRIRVGSSPVAVAIHPGGQHAVVLNRFSNYASVIDLARDEVVSEVALDFYAQDIAFDRAGKRAFVSVRYLDQVIVLDVEAGAGRFEARVRPLGGFDDAPFLRPAAGEEGLHSALRASCGTVACHRKPRGGFYAGEDPLRAYLSAVENATPGRPEESLLLNAALRAQEGGFADDRARGRIHAGGLAPWRRSDPGYRAVAAWIAAARDGPGIAVGNRGSKPGALALSSDERRLYAGNLGTQDVSVVDLERLEEVTGVFIQNAALDLAVVPDPPRGRDLLVVASLGAGFGAPRERDPFGGESGDPRNPAAQFTVLRDPETTEPLPLERQRLLGRFDAVDGTAAFKMGDIQNDLTVVDASRLVPPPAAGAGGELTYALRADRYEAHAGWVRYTSDSAEALPHDVSGDIPPELQRVPGAFPEALAVEGDRLYAVMLGSFELVEWRIDAGAADPADLLEPVAIHRTGVMPRRLAVGPRGTPAEGLVLVTNFLGETVSVIDVRAGTSVEVPVGDLRRPFPDSDAERGEVFVHTAIFSGDGDTSCMSCHIHDTSDGRAWGAGQAIAQMRDGKFASGGLLAIPQMRNLFAAQPFYFEGTHTAFDAQLDDAREHVPLQAFLAPSPAGDYTGTADPAPIAERRAVHEELQDKMSAAPFGPLYHDLEARRDAHVRRVTMERFGKAYVFRDLQRWIGEFQAAETRLVPNPFDPRSPSVARGRVTFNDLGVGCVACHKPPHFTDKGEALTHNRERVLPPLVTFTDRTLSYTLVSPHWMDAVNGHARDVEPWERGRVERREGMVTTFPLRGLFDRPFALLHDGRALTVRESIAAPGHYALRRFRYAPLRGGEAVRPSGRERGFNERGHLEERTYVPDTHGATSQLGARQLEDLENFLLSIE